MNLLKAAVSSLLALSLATPAMAARVVPRTVEMTVTKEGFVPAEVKVKKGEPLKLVITRKVEKTCATEVVLDGVKKELPLEKPVEIQYTPKRTGQIKYACAMGMIGGVLVVE